MEVQQRKQQLVVDPGELEAGDLRDVLSMISVYMPQGSL